MPQRPTTFDDKRVPQPEALKATRRIVIDPKRYACRHDKAGRKLLDAITVPMASAIIAAEMTVDQLDRFERTMARELMNELED